jgi:arsenical-resistance protein 2
MVLRLVCLSANFQVKETELFPLGSSRGRGTRAAGWFNDYIQEQSDKEMKSVILVGGIKGWATAGEDYAKSMDGYVAEYWTQFQS